MSSRRPDRKVFRLRSALPHSAQDDSVVCSALPLSARDDNLFEDRTG